MLAIANALQRRGGTVRMAGGGAGSQFVALNGYDEFEPTTVDFIDTYQGGSAWATLSRSLPASLSRIVEYQAWLTTTEPDALVTDDMFAAMAASRCDVPLYVVKHDMPTLYDDPVERAGAGFHTRYQLSAAREFFYPVVWPESGGDPDDATRIPPVALDGDETVEEAPDVVVVPSHYSSLSRIAGHLRRQGYDVLDVADDGWDPVPALLPYIRGADVVVCSGYSTIMDAAVAGTPCVVLPETDEQDAVAEWLERFDVDGFAVADQPIDVLDAVEDPPEPPAFDNGAEYVAQRVLTDLRDPDPYAEPDDSTASVDEEAVAPSGIRSLVAVPTLAAVVATTATTTASPRRLARRSRRVVARLLGVVRAGGRRLRSGAGTVASRAADAVPDRVGTATSRVTSALSSGARRVGSGIESGATTAVDVLRTVGRGVVDRCRSLSLPTSVRR
jgi:hypothetical protein